MFRKSISLSYCTLSLASLVLIAGLVLVPSGAAGQVNEQGIRQSLVEIRGFTRPRLPRSLWTDRESEYYIGTGFLVNDEGYVVTVGQRALRSVDRVEVMPYPGGFGVRVSYEVGQIEYHAALELTLLHVPGLSEQSLTFADPGEVGSGVKVPLYTGEQFALPVGVIESFITRPVRAYGNQEQELIVHSTVLNSLAAYGAPLLNEEDQIVGINHPDPTLSAGQLARYIAPDGSAYAVPSQTLREFFRANGVEFVDAGQTSLSNIGNRSEIGGIDEIDDSTEGETSDEVIGELEEAREGVEEATRALNAALEDLESSEQEKNELTDNLEAERARVADLERRLRDLEDGSEEDPAVDPPPAELPGRLIISAIAGAIALLLAGLWYYSHSRSSAAKLGKAEARAEDAEEEARRAHSVAARAAKPAPFSCLMEGRSPEGRSYTIKIPAIALGASEGVVIGRNPEHATMVVDHKGMSRQHAKLSMIDDALHIEDLNSTNGSFVNDVRLVPTQKLPLRDGCTVRLGPIPFRLKLSRAARNGPVSQLWSRVRGRDKS